MIHYSKNILNNFINSALFYIAYEPTLLNYGPAKLSELGVSLQPQRN